MDNDNVPAGRVSFYWLQWSPVFAGALFAAALSLVLISFAATIGLGVSSSSPTWRDASAALALLSGLYLILQAVVSFGVGGYIAGRSQRTDAARPAELVETSDGLHGLTSWALAVLIGAIVLALVGWSTAQRPASERPSLNSAEPLLSYELDRLFRSARRPANIDIGLPRAEAGRILLTGSGHSGVSTDDRNYLIQQVAAMTGAPAADAEKRVDVAIADSRTSIAQLRRSSTILAFSIAAALLFGAVAAWAAAAVGGRHRDGATMPHWMVHRSTTAEPVI
ncbi:hypothetical protein JQ604_05985 [Bradyrhizobium jicamae]|uniref:hypothetical protein n=1 Tax=Bradyrhizobium jicamae TaxID=280332 RepID=UPI001BAC39CF|nr:hypothetical protein [Bradyrhizobium jicamae]MBR0751725.1 hypothetical protein [Bradyrhizobium jicamae]